MKASSGWKKVRATASMAETEAKVENLKKSTDGLHINWKNNNEGEKIQGLDKSQVFFFSFVP